MAANVEMKAYKVAKIDFTNKVNGKVQLKLKNKVSHKVKYNTNNFCEATLDVEVSDPESPDVLNVTVSIVGAFSIKNKIEKEFLHVETFNELYPFAKALVATISVNAGVPPIYLQYVDISNQEIYRFDMNNKE